MAYFFNRPLVTGGLALAVTCLSSLAFLPEARAQDEATLMEARSKFQRAIELEQAGNYAGALKLYREVGSVKMTPQVRYHIALCEEKLGQLVAALGGYELAMSAGQDMPQDFIAEVQTSIDELKARIPKLLIERGDGAEAASIELDGVALGQTSIGVEIPLNPGPHTISAESPGYEPFQQTVTVSEGTSDTLTVTLEEIVEPEPEPPPSPAAPPPKEPLFGPLPYVIGGAGIFAAVTGGVLIGVSQVNVGKIKKICDGGTDCSQIDETEERRARRLEKSAIGLETAGWVTLGVGLAATGVGVVMYYVDSRRSRETVSQSRLRLMPIVTHQSWGLHLSAGF